MARPEFENQTAISAMTSKKITYTDVNTAVDIIPNTTERHSFFSAPNTMSRITNLKVYWLKELLVMTGNRRMAFNNYISAVSGLGVFEAICNDPNKDLVFDNGDLTNDNTNVYANDRTGITFSPNDIAAINNNLREVRFDDVYGIQFSFIHDSATNLTEQRRMIFFAEEEKVKR